MPLVQHKIVSSGGSAVDSIQATFDTAPAEGSLLVAVVAQHAQRTHSTPSGWTAGPTLDATGTNLNNGIRTFLRKAGASESSTVTASWASTSRTVFAIFEVDTGDPDFNFGDVLDRVATNLADTGNVAAMSTGTTDETRQADEWLLAIVGHRTRDNIYAGVSWNNAFEQAGFAFTTGSGNTAGAVFAQRPINQLVEAEATASGFGNFPATSTDAAFAMMLTFRVEDAGGVPPTVDPGPDVFRHPLPVTFERTAHDDGRGEEITDRQWKIQAGPDRVDEVLSTSAAVEFEPSSVGTYTLRYSATNATDTTTGDIAVQVLDRPVGFVGGAYVESPGHIGPFQAAEDAPYNPGVKPLYFLIEESETNNWPTMMQSVNYGKSWNILDPGNRPSGSTGNDLEGVDALHDGDVFRYLHQPGSNVYHHIFRTADHPTDPDTWGTVGEQAANLPNFAYQAVALARLGSTLVGVGSPADALSHFRRNGSWSSATAFGDANAHSGPMAVASGGVAHIVYYESGDGGSIFYRTLDDAGNLSARTLLDSGVGTGSQYLGAVLPLIAYTDGGDDIVHAMWLNSGHLWESLITNGTPGSIAQVTDRTVISNAVDSNQPCASFDGDLSDGLHLVFADATDQHLWRMSNLGSGWASSILLNDEAQGEWVRGRVIDMPGGRVFGYIWDDASGGTGGGDDGPVYFDSFPLTTFDPANLQATVDGATVTLAWDPSPMVPE